MSRLQLEQPVLRPYNPSDHYQAHLLENNYGLEWPDINYFEDLTLLLDLCSVNNFKCSHFTPNVLPRRRWKNILTCGHADSQRYLHLRFQCVLRKTTPRVSEASPDGVLERIRPHQEKFKNSLHLHQNLHRSPSCPLLLHAGVVQVRSMLKFRQYVGDAPQRQQHLKLWAEIHLEQGIILCHQLFLLRYHPCFLASFLVHPYSQMLLQRLRWRRSWKRWED